MSVQLWTGCCVATMKAAAGTPYGWVEDAAIAVEVGALAAARRHVTVVDMYTPFVQTPDYQNALLFDLASGEARRQIAYVPDAIPAAPFPAGAFADNGVSEILMIDAHRMLVLERAYATDFVDPPVAPALVPSLVVVPTALPSLTGVAIQRPFSRNRPWRV